MSLCLNMARSQYQKHRVHKGSWRDRDDMREALRLQNSCPPNVHAHIRPLSRASTSFLTDVDCSDTFRTFAQCPCIRLNIIKPVLGIGVRNRKDAATANNSVRTRAEAMFTTASAYPIVEEQRYLALLRAANAIATSADCDCASNALVERLKEVTAFDFIHVATFDKETNRTCWSLLETNGKRVDSARAGRSFFRTFSDSLGSRNGPAPRHARLGPGGAISDLRAFPWPTTASHRPVLSP